MNIHTSIKRTLSATAIVLGCSFPLATVAENVVQAQDTIAGMGAEIRFAGFESSADLDCTVQTPDGDELLFPVHTDAKGNATIELRPRETEQAGLYSILVNATVIGSFEALPELLDPYISTIEARDATIDPNGRDSVEVWVHIQDRYKNALSGRPVALISNRNEDQITPLSRESNAQGDQGFMVTTTVPGMVTLRAMDLLSGTMLSRTVELLAGDVPAVGNRPVMPTVTSVPRNTLSANLSQNRFYYFNGQVTSYDVVDHFRITAPATAQLGVELQNVSLEAMDKMNRRVLDYVGSVVFSSTDPLATLPLGGEYTFKQVNQGLKDFPVVFKFETPGTQTLRVEDKNERTILGEATIVVSGLDPSGNSGKKIVITSHKNRQGVNTSTIVLEGDAPPFINLIVQGGLVDATGESTQGGRFTIPVQLNPEQKDTTIRIRDEANRYDSGPLLLVYDPDPPSIKSVTFSPQIPETQMETMIAVQTEEKLPKVTLTINDPITGASEEITLLENITAPGTYQAFFTPTAAGNYQPTISAMDNAGNTDFLRTTFKVQSRGLSRVEGLTAVPIMSEVELHWNAVPEDVDGYRIYIGENADDFPYTLDTGRPITLTRVRGLIPGKQYAFALTALKDDAESKEKSDVITVRIMGLTLDVTPQPNALLVRWSNFGKDLPLQSFIFEYGLSPEALTEKRLLHGDLRAYTLRDLLGGVQYYLRLTPVTTTGDLLTDLAATGEGTPLNSGEFTASPGDPIPGAGSFPGFPSSGNIDDALIPSTTLPPLQEWSNGGQLPLDAPLPTPPSGTTNGGLDDEENDGTTFPPLWEWQSGGALPPVGSTGNGDTADSLPPFGSDSGYGNGTTPPPAPVDELHSGAPLEPVGIPPIAWWFASGATIPGFGIFLKMRRRQSRTKAFLKMVEAKYHG